jgi:tetratricopeptide (TPR) repeat protein
MTDKSPASDLIREGLTLWEAGDLEAAEAKYREALGRVSEGDWGRPHVRAHLAGVLAARGHNQEALEQYERTLEEELALAEGDNSPAVRASRYFLGEHLVRIGQPSAALTVVAPMLGLPGDFALRLVEAEAQRALGDQMRAVAALQRALESATTDKQRDEVRARIARMEQSPDDTG